MLLTRRHDYIGRRRPKLQSSQGVYYLNTHATVTMGCSITPLFLRSAFQFEAEMHLNGLAEERRAC